MFSSLLVSVLLQNIFTPSFFAAWQQNRGSVPGHAYTLSLLKRMVEYTCNLICIHETLQHLLLQRHM